MLLRILRLSAIPIVVLFTIVPPPLSPILVTATTTPQDGGSSVRNPYVRRRSRFVSLPGSIRMKQQQQQRRRRPQFSSRHSPDQEKTTTTITTTRRRSPFAFVVPPLPSSFVSTTPKTTTTSTSTSRSKSPTTTPITITTITPITTTRLDMSSQDSESNKDRYNRYYDDNYDDDDDEYDYELLVIGGGPGGIAMARRAEQYGLANTIALVDTQGPTQLGGTCVHGGSYPKKVMWYTASIAETLQHMHHYGFTAPQGIQFDWTTLQQHRKAYLDRLTSLYHRHMVQEDVEDSSSSTIHVLQGVAQFTTTDPHTIQITMSPDMNEEEEDNMDNMEPYVEEYTARHIVIATGAKSVVQENIRDHTITTDEFFQLTEMPSKIVVVGGGCTAVEMAGIVQSLGCDTSLVVRDRRPLWNTYVTPFEEKEGGENHPHNNNTTSTTTSTTSRKFDDMLIDGIYEEMQKHGIFIYRNTQGIQSIRTSTSTTSTSTSNSTMEEEEEKGVDGHNPNHNQKSHSSHTKKTVTLNNGEVIDQVDVVLMAIGRTPRTDALQLSNAGIVQEEVSTKGYIQVNEHSETNVQGIYAIGDVSTTFPHVTPMAIASGRRLADRLFGSNGNGNSGNGNGGGNSGNSSSSSSSSTTTTTTTNTPPMKQHIHHIRSHPPQVIFSQPPMGMVGLTEAQAIEQYGAENVVVYRSKFSNLYYGVWQNVDPDEKPQTSMKMICCTTTTTTTNTNTNTNPQQPNEQQQQQQQQQQQVDEERVVGLHVIGLGADEMIQGFGVAVQMGATKADFDACLAIHPTASEEFVTMYPWGMTKATSSSSCSSSSSSNDNKNDNNHNANEEEEQDESSS